MPSWYVAVAGVMVAATAPQTVPQNRSVSRRDRRLWRRGRKRWKDRNLSFPTLFPSSPEASIAPRYGSVLSAMLSYRNVILSERTVRHFMLSYPNVILPYGRVEVSAQRVQWHSVSFVGVPWGSFLPICCAFRERGGHIVHTTPTPGLLVRFAADAMHRRRGFLPRGPTVW